VTPGALDTLALTAAVVRSGCADAGAADAVRLIGTRSIIVRANVAFERYLFSKAERAVIDMLVREPSTLSELERRSPLSRAALARIIFTLWITRAATPAPTWLRSVSGPISHPAPPLDQRPDEEQTIVMKSFVRSIGSYSQRAPEHGVMGLWDSPKRDSQSPPADDSPRARADEHFRTAELLLERGHAREAVFEAQLALRLCEPRPEQRALYGWALYQRGGGRGTVPACVWEHIETALLVDPNCQQALQYRALLLRQSAPPRRSAGT
jgi:hypothetical protein